ncbi:unnamed protein product [Heligmosomoides polygyrus]|uniref:Disintegrin domain-containing protein n=1 Tax=Heligmosomoides polygyrus TaxID=6339 RepID=A0A183FGV0_HELPZ|nr:unnamed protein product [Heligmosomoides polygyrus]
MVAQSLGHLFGLEHDTPSCQCDSESSNQRCIMNDRPGSPGAPFTWQFSKCSIARMHGVWQSGHPSQLRECGNGVVDGSEECDCGSRETCTDPCCDPLTCTLRAHAQCAAHHQCCHRCEVCLLYDFKQGRTAAESHRTLSGVLGNEVPSVRQCQQWFQLFETVMRALKTKNISGVQKLWKLRKAGEVCRNARSACDVAEMCDGKSGDCPPDGHLVDGTACGRDGQCWRGNCSDPHQQCQAIWGEGARVADQECFKQNTRGYEYANCGAIDSTGTYRSCQADHTRCGTLHCQDGASTPSQSALRSFTFQFQQDEKQVGSIKRRERWSGARRVKLWHWQGLRGRFLCGDVICRFPGPI